MFYGEDVSWDCSESGIRPLMDPSRYYQYPSGGAARRGRGGRTRGGRGGNRAARGGNQNLSDRIPSYGRGRNPRRGCGDQYSTQRNANTNSDKQHTYSQNDRDMYVSARDRTNVDTSDSESITSESSSIQQNQPQVPVTDIFKKVIRNYNGVATLTQVKKEFGHFFSNDQDTISWFKKKGKSYFRVFENKKSPSKTQFVVYMKGLRPCIRYSTEDGCSADKCNFLHCCRQHLVNNCHLSNCRFNHDIASDHNKRVIEKYAQSQIHQDLTDPELLRAVRCGAIKVCVAYNNRGCSNENGGTCRHLHICKAFVTNACEYSEATCEKSHNFDTCKRTIQVFGMEGISQSMLKKLVLVKTQTQEGDDCNNQTSVSETASKRIPAQQKEGMRSNFNKNVANDNTDNPHGTSWTDADIADMVSKDNLSDSETNTVDENAGSGSRVCNEALKNQVFDILLKYHDGLFDVVSLNCCTELSPPDNWLAFLKKYPEDFILLEVDRQNSDLPRNTYDKMITYKRCMQICGEYAARKTHSKPCNQIHLCREFVEGFCAKENTCDLSHDLLDDYNHGIVGNANLLTYNKQYLLTLVRCSSATVCTYCDKNGNCENDRYGICPYIHVCAKFMRNKCGNTRCPYDHDIKSKYIRTSLSRYFDPIPSLPVLKDAILIPRREEDSRPSSPVGRIIHDTDADICEEHVRKECSQGEDCTKHHCDTPYLWQYQKDSVWIDLDEGEAIEKQYSQPQELRVQVQIDGERCEGYLKEMMLLAEESRQCYLIRRLTTASYVTGRAQRSYLTHWVLYWQECDSVWTAYASENDTPCQDIIEANYLNRENLSRMRFERGRYDYQIDFSALEITQTNLDTGKVRSVRRRPKFVSSAEVLKGEMPEAPVLHFDSTDLPDHWSPMDTGIRHDISFVKIELPSTHHEYTTVLKKFNKSISIENQYRVKSIYRVQNPDLWRVYASKTEAMKRKLNNFEALNELKLFHGTDSQTVEAICNQNFDHRLHGKNATAYGCGAYFARKASYSNRYTSKGRIRHMFLARVLIGRSAKGSSSYRRPPPVNPAKPHGALCDSCVDDTGSPSIYVIFDKDQCYPEYLIEYEDLNAAYSESGARPKIRRSLSPPSNALSSVRATRTSPTVDVRPKVRQIVASSSNDSNLVPTYSSDTTSRFGQHSWTPPTPPLRRSPTTTQTLISSPNDSSALVSRSSAFNRVTSIGTEPGTNISSRATASTTRNSTMTTSTVSPISINSDHDSHSGHHLPSTSASTLRRPPQTSSRPGTDLRSRSTLSGTDFRATSTLPGNDLGTTSTLLGTDVAAIHSAVGEADLVLQQEMLDQYKALARAKKEREEREKRNNEAREQLRRDLEERRRRDAIERQEKSQREEKERKIREERVAAEKAKKKDGCIVQ